MRPAKQSLRKPGIHHTDWLLTRLTSGIQLIIPHFAKASLKRIRRLPAFSTFSTGAKRKCIMTIEHRPETWETFSRWEPCGANHGNKSEFLIGRKTMKQVVRLFLLSVTLSGVAYAQTFDGTTPAEEVDCDQYSGASYGLCVAYCEAQDCDVNTTQPSCDSLRKNFQKKTGSSTFPCDPRCGDGAVNQGFEECDDGNAIDCDGCSTACLNQPSTDPACGGGDPECVGQTCETFTNCNAAGSCGFNGVCGSTIEGTGRCVDGSTACAGLPDCATTADCGPTAYCFQASCCGRNVCVDFSRLCSEP